MGEESTSFHTWKTSNQNQPDTLQCKILFLVQPPPSHSRDKESMVCDPAWRTGWKRGEKGPFASFEVPSNSPTPLFIPLFSSKTALKSYRLAPVSFFNLSLFHLTQAVEWGEQRLIALLEVTLLQPVCQLDVAQLNANGPLVANIPIRFTERRI